MKQLFVLRHAKSSWDSTDLRDFDRPLNERGQKAAEAIGADMRKRRLKFDSVLASPAVRVRQTLACVEKGYGLFPVPRFERRIYDADPETLLALVREAEDSVECLLVVGHNPGLQEALLALTSADDAGLRGQIEDKYPTGALAEVELDVDRWSEAGPGTGRLLSLTRPRDLD